MENLDAGRICRDLDGLEKNGVEFEVLLSRAVRLLHESNPRFDWTGIYELYPEGVLRLGPFIGEPSEHVSITVGQGVCGTAVARKCTMNIPDVSKASNYLACSAATKSELVVLIRRGDRIYAQIDIDSHELGAFSDEIVDEVERLSDWLAHAYEKRG